MQTKPQATSEFRPHPVPTLSKWKRTFGQRRTERRRRIRRRHHVGRRQRNILSPSGTESHGLARHGHIGVFFRILETGVFPTELQQHVAHGTVTVLGDDDFRHTVQVVPLFVLVNLVIFGAMDKTNHIGILLDGSGFTQVAQLRTLAVDTLTVLHPTVQLAQRNNRYVQFLGQPLERTRNGADLLLTAAERHSTGIHQLEIVYQDNLDPMLAHQTPGFRTQLENGQRRRIVHIKRGIIQLGDFIIQLRHS